MSRLADVILRGDRASQPAATAVSNGALYFVTDQNVIERSNGTNWETYSGTAATGGSGGGSAAGIALTDMLEDPEVPLILPPYIEGSNVNLNNGVRGTLLVPNGGTGVGTFTAYSVICAGTTSTGAFQNVSGLGSAGQLLTSNGAGALPSWQAAPSGGIPLTTSFKWLSALRNDNSVTNILNFGASTTSGSSSNVVDSSSTWQRLTTSTGANAFGGYQSAGSLDMPVFSHLPTMIFRMRTGSAITAARYWIGLFDSTTLTTAPGTSATGVLTRAHAAFRYVDGTDTGWVGSVADGTTQTVSGGNVAAIGTSTEYILKIRFSSNTAANFSVNGGSETTVNLNTANADTIQTSFSVVVTNVTGGNTRFIDWTAVYGQYS